MTKASRTELQHGLQRATEAALDAQDRSKAVASDLLSVAFELDSRASHEAVARLEALVLGLPLPPASRLDKAHRAAPVIRTQRAGATGTMLLPSHCLSCHQPLPHPPSPPPPHETPKGGAPQAGGDSRSSPQRAHSSMSAGTNSMSAGVSMHASSTRLFYPFKAADTSHHAKVAFGREPTHEVRKRMQQQLAASATAAMAGRLKVDAILGSGAAVGGRPGRPASAPVLHKPRKMRGSASAAHVVNSGNLDLTTAATKGDVG